MFIIKSSYKAPLEEIDKYLQAHREYLEYYYKQGLLLASGPLNPRTGGIIIVMAKDRARVNEILEKDPFIMAELIDYEIFEFTPVKHNEALKELILNSEGKLC